MLLNQDDGLLGASLPVASCGTSGSGEGTRGYWSTSVSYLCSGRPGRSVKFRPLRGGGAITDNLRCVGRPPVRVCRAFAALKSQQPIPMIDSAMVSMSLNKSRRKKARNFKTNAFRAVIRLVHVCLAFSSRSASA